MEATLDNKIRIPFPVRAPVVFMLLASVAFLLPGFATAAGWNIDPVRIELSQEQQTAALTITNDSDQPTSIQIQAVDWSQVDGKDVFSPTREILISPPLVTIAPKAEQIIRVALRRPADSSSELAYRINLQELPPPPSPEFVGVQVALRIGLPVFVQSQKGGVAPKAIWKVTKVADDTLKVEVRNQGTAHIQISDFALYVAGGEKPITDESVSSYVLAGQTRTWELKTSSLLKIADGRLRLKAYTDADNVDTEVKLEKP
jgi:fimbrial chaperone protein